MGNIAKTEIIEKLNPQEFGEGMTNFLRGMVRTMFMEVMLDEVSAVCGDRYKHNSQSDYRRAGSAPGQYFFGTEEVKIHRPRVRKKTAGKEEEAVLNSYRTAQNRDELNCAMMRALVAGVPSREQKRLYKDVRGSSKSSISRLWELEGKKYIDQLHNRDLSQDIFVALMLDGIGFSEDITAVVALGITADGDKKVLGFKIGNSESFEVCNDLMISIIDRGFKPSTKLLAITDGSKALRKAVLKHYDNALIQRCLIHKERNVKAYLSYRHHSEVQTKFSHLRKAQGLEDALEICIDLADFLKDKNQAALNSFIEAGEELFAVHSLNVPSTLNPTLLNTNCIENAFKNVRRKTGRVNRWKKNTDMSSRWVAYSLIEAENGFRKIRNYKDLGKLIEALENFSPPPEEGKETELINRLLTYNT